MYAKFLTNRQGQTLIEACVFLLALAALSTFTIGYSIRLLQTIAVDDALESYLLCSTYEATLECKTRLMQKLKTFALQIQKIDLDRSDHRSNAKMTVRNHINQNWNRSREILW